MQVFLMPPTPIHNFHSSITWVAKNTTGFLLHSLLVYTQVRLERPKHSLKYSQALTAHINESPTNNPLKYIQAVNVKSIPVQADTSGGPASTKQLVPC